MKSLKYWSTDHFTTSTYKFNLTDRINKSFNTCGSDNTKLCTYTYNELGFRGDSINKKGFKVMSIGCSITEGVGVNDDNTWSSQFSKLILNGVDFNLGISGRSNDYICRALLTFYELMKPDLVLIMYTSPQRREVYTINDGIEPFMPTAAWGYMEETEDGKKIQNYLTKLQNDNEDLINWYKNHQLIKYFLESKKCNWLWNGFNGIPKEYKECNRFDGDYDNFIDRGLDGNHPGPNHNQIYSQKLYNFINQNLFILSNSKNY
jgi:hypothetical protein